MKKLLFILALLCAPLARGQSSFQNPLQGPITATSAACAVAGDQSCVWQKLALAASVATVQASGTFSATLTVEANNGGANFTTLGTITSAGTTSYVVAGFTDFRVRASAYASGTASVTINSSPAPSGGVTSGTADPTGTACGPNTLYVQTTTGKLYSCDAGVFAIVSGGGGSGTVTSVSFTGGLISVATPTTTPALTVAGTSGGIPYFSAAATWASSAAGTVNTLMKWGGAGNPPIASSVTDNGTTVATTEPFTAPSVSTGGTPPAITAGTGGAFGSAEGTAPSVGLPAAGVDGCYADSTQHAYLCSYNNGSFFRNTQTICAGTQALATGAIGSGAAATTITTTCTGLASTDNIQLDFNASPLAVTGYTPSANGMLTIIKWPTANTINISVVNNTASSITPGAITLNYRVTR